MTERRWMFRFLGDGTAELPQFHDVLPIGPGPGGFDDGVDGVVVDLAEQRGPLGDRRRRYRIAVHGADLGVGPDSDVGENWRRRLSNLTQEQLTAIRLTGPTEPDGQGLPAGDRGRQHLQRRQLHDGRRGGSLVGEVEAKAGPGAQARAVVW